MIPIKLSTQYLHSRHCKQTKTAAMLCRCTSGTLLTYCQDTVSTYYTDMCFHFRKMNLKLYLLTETAIGKQQKFAPFFFLWSQDEERVKEFIQSVLLASKFGNS